MENRKEKRVKIYDVAKASGFGLSTVSMALKGEVGIALETRKKIQKIANQLGYKPSSSAQLLRQKKSMLIGVCAQNTQEFHQSIIDTIYAESEKYEYNVIVENCSKNHKEQDVIDSFLNLKTQAIIMIGSSLTCEQLKNIAKNIPLITIGKNYHSDSFVQIFSNYTLATEQNTELLISQGHKKIALFEGNDLPGAEEHKHGYIKAMKNHELTPLCIDSGGTEQAGISSFNSFFKKKKEFNGTSAIITYNDHCAFGVMFAAYKHGLAIPNDFSLIGFDNSSLSKLKDVSLTSVEQYHNLQGKKALISAIELIGKKDIQTEISISPKTIIRKSIGSIR